MKRILIDPGHGGNDRANKGPTTYIEADGNLAFASALRTILLKYNVEVTLTRDCDKTVELAARGKMAKGYDMFLSIHSNAGGGTGTSVFYSIRQEENLSNAQMLCADFSNYFGVRNRGASFRESTNSKGYDYYTVIFYAQKSGCPHVYLLERLFHDNRAEELLLLDNKKTKESAEMVAEWIAEVLELYGIPISETPMYTPGIYKVTEVTALNLRKGPGTEYTAIRSVPKYTLLNVSEIKNKGWGYVSELGAWCNISTTYCTKTDLYIPHKGDIVCVTGKLYSNTQGGNYITKRSAQMQVLDIFENKKYSYAFAKIGNQIINGYGDITVIEGAIS